MDTSLSTTTSTLSCPCCAFLSRSDVFIPRLEVKSRSNYANRVDTTSEVDVLSVQDFIAHPTEAWDRILKNKPRGKENAIDYGRVILVDTHGHPHLQRETQYANIIDAGTLFDGLVVSLTCAVSPADWKDALIYSSQSSYFLH